jgi:ATP-dependent DNA helicase RecG
MITKDEIQELLRSTETYRVERTTSTGDIDKFQEAICAFANDLSGSLKKGYLILRAYDNGGNVGGKMAVIMSPVCPQLCHKLSQVGSRSS